MEWRKSHSEGLPVGKGEWSRQAVGRGTWSQLLDTYHATTHFPKKLPIMLGRPPVILNSDIKNHVHISFNSIVISQTQLYSPKETCM